MISLDYETIELTDKGPVASTEAYRSNFRVDSMALAFADGAPSEFIQGEDAVYQRLLKIPPHTPIIVHNLQFEQIVTKCRFPGLELNFSADTMRLAQLYDNGGDDSDVEYVVNEDTLLDDDNKIKRKPISGLSLVKCAKRILGAKESHKDEAHTWIRTNVSKSKGKEGKFLNLLPLDILTRYNIADAEITLQLYKYITEYFKSVNFDWSLDWSLYTSTVNHLVNAKIRGILVDRHTLIANRDTVAAEFTKIGVDFAAQYTKEIANIECQRAVDWVCEVKTRKGRTKRYQKWCAGHEVALDKIKFNVGSNKQLALLFMGQLGMSPKFFTEKGAPSFKSAMLSQWGPGGEALKARRKRLLVLKQTESLLALSEHDGQWHSDVKACGTSTGRLAGGRV